MIGEVFWEAGNILEVGVESSLLVPSLHSKTISPLARLSFEVERLGYIDSNLLLASVEGGL
jgi:hypothetical protein